TQIENQQYREKQAVPACVKASPADALHFGERDQILKEAHNRISSHPDKYVDHVYGEKEAGGTSVVYLSSVPFAKLGFPELDDKPYPAVPKLAIHGVPPAVLAVGAMLGGVFHLLKRRAAMA